MILKIDQSGLSSAVQTNLRAISSQSTLPVLGGVKITANKDHAIISSTNLEMYIQSLVSANVPEGGEVVIPARLSADIIRNFPSGLVNLSKEQGESQIKILCEGIKYQVNTLEAADFPAIPLPEKFVVTGTIDFERFKELVRQVTPAASTDGSRPVLGGILMSLSGGELKAVATDSYRLAVKNIPLSAREGGTFEGIIPARSLSEAAKVLNGKEITVKFADNVGIFEGEGVLLSTRLIEGTFPNYKQLIPEEIQTRFTLNKADFENSVRRASILSGHQSPVKLDFSAGKVEITTVHEAQAAEITLPLIDGSDTFTIAFNPRFLVDGLTSITGDVVDIEFTDSLKPAVLRGKNRDLLYLLMPVKLA